MAEPRIGSADLRKAWVMVGAEVLTDQMLP
jgi:hypothetical protein